MSLPKVTLIVTQRERFCLTKPSLESILADYDSYPFQLIYVDGNSPPHIAEYLQQQADKYEFITLIRQEHYLRSNEARNLAITLSKDADYVVFFDNDDIVEPGWLKPLVDCAETENAAIVSPLILQGYPQIPEKEVHVAGIDTIWHQRKFGKKWFQQKQLYYAQKLVDVQNKLSCKVIDSVEFHCLLARRSLFENIELDNVFDSLASHTDLCMQAQAQGGLVYLEPASMITFLNPRQVPCFTPEDLPFYRYKWSEKATGDIFKRCIKKWNLEKKDPSLWSIWRWVIENRQLPVQDLVESGSQEEKLLQIAQHRLCPGWLRMFLEGIVIKRVFPQTGVPHNCQKIIDELNQFVSDRSASVLGKL